VDAVWLTARDDTLVTMLVDNGVATAPTIVSSVDNTMIESFWSTMQRELLDTRTWDTQAQLASAIFEWIEGWYNPRRRHTSLGMLAPAEYEALHAAANTAA
jgi:putative transposase